MNNYDIFLITATHNPSTLSRSQSISLPALISNFSAIEDGIVDLSWSCVELALFTLVFILYFLSIAFIYIFAYTLKDTFK
jgi:hypothetical protein